MTNQVIPEAAVGAALDAYDPSWVLVPGDWDQHFKNRMRAALNAASPHILAQALEEAALEWPKHQAAHMGKGTVQQIGAWLRARAATYRPAK